MIDFPLLTDTDEVINTKTSDSYDYIKNVITEKIYNNEITINEIYEILVLNPPYKTPVNIDDGSPDSATTYSSFKTQSILGIKAIEAISTVSKIEAFGSGYILGGILKITHTGKDNIAIYMPQPSRPVVFKKTIDEGATWTDIHTGGTTGIIIDGEALGVIAHYICHSVDGGSLTIADNGTMYRTLCTER